MKVYISGKISGLTEKEYTENFHTAYSHLFEKQLVDCSLNVINPLNIKPLFGIKKWFFYMCADLWQLKKCDAIAVQKNWVNSKGAFIEVFFSKFIFKQVIILL